MDPQPCHGEAQSNGRYDDDNPFEFQAHPPIPWQHHPEIKESLIKYAHHAPEDKTEEVLVVHEAHAIADEGTVVVHHQGALIAS